VRLVVVEHPGGASAVPHRPAQVLAYILVSSLIMGWVWVAVDIVIVLDGSVLCAASAVLSRAFDPNALKLTNAMAQQQASN